MPEIATVRPPRKGPIMRQRSSWYIDESTDCAARTHVKRKMQSEASRIETNRVFTFGPRREARINQGRGDCTEGRGRFKPEKCDTRFGIARNFFGSGGVLT